jgi:hypothetical protein
MAWHCDLPPVEGVVKAAVNDNKNMAKWTTHVLVGRQILSIDADLERIARASLLTTSQLYQATWENAKAPKSKSLSDKKDAEHLLHFLVLSCAYYFDDDIIDFQRT